MKVYRLTADIDRKYAQIHSQMEQEPKEGITVMWDDWLVKGNIIPDFIFSVYSISKTKIIEGLQNRFNGLEKIKLLWEKNPKEEVAKNIHRLKWLPKEKVDLSAMITTAQIPFLSQSTVVYSMDSGGKKYIDKVIGIENYYGGNLLPRESGKGFFFDKKAISDYDFFTPIGIPNTRIYCTEKVKLYIQDKEYTNVYFIEVGDII